MLLTLKLELQQAPWLKSYIYYNTDKRKAATSDFKKDFSNWCLTVYTAKSMESLRKRVNVELVNNERRMKKALAKPTCKNFTILNEDLVKVQFIPKKIIQNKLVYTGFVVLKLSKVLMYKFHYKHIQGQWRWSGEDTDSHYYQIQTEDLYEDTASNLQHYDNSAYPKTHPLYNPANVKVIGKFKDETSSIPPEEFVGLRSKIYSLRCNYPKMTAKGIKKNYIKRHVRHSAFVDALRDNTTSTVRFKTFNSVSHIISTSTLTKSVALWL